MRFRGPVSFLLTLAGVAFVPSVHASASCTPQTVGFGAEKGSLVAGPPAVAAYPVLSSIQITSVTLLTSFIPNTRGPGSPPPSGWGEALVIFGVSPTANPDASWPALTDPDIGAGQGFGGDFHGNAPTDGILASPILKADMQAANEPVTKQVDITVPAGQYLYLRFGAAGPPADVEAQVTLDYTPIGC